MGLSLLGAAAAGALANGDECNLGGYSADSPTEANTQISCTEDATFSKLGFAVRSGGSGTNTLQFRDAGANGNQVVSFAGASSGEDATNTDALSAGDLFNLAYTDTGTDSTINWIKGNVQFSSGHGNFHIGAQFAGIVHDAASSTRFLKLYGSMAVDGLATEDQAEWKTHAYDTFEAIQVRVTANARTNNSDFRNRIDGANGTGLVQFTAGATGLLSDTAIGDAITDGQTVNMSITLDTGVEDLTVSLCAGTFKSSSNKSETFMGSTGTSRAASSTEHYVQPVGNLYSLTALTEANARIKVGFAAVVSNLRCYLSANTYTGDGTLKLYQNGSAVITTTITASGGAAWYENTSDTITIDADDELSFAFDEGTTGDITIHVVGITFAPVAAPGGTILPQMMLHGLFLGMRT